MNPTPCSLCNHLLAKRLNAFIKTEWPEFRRLQNELDAHQAKCQELHSPLYLLLWPTARLIVPVACSVARSVAAETEE